LEIRDAHLLNPAFQKYCDDGIKYFEENKVDEKIKQKYIKAFDEYIFMKEKIRDEVSIMEANRVGVDKNIASIIKNTASHVGL
jgi:hypothetical protein